MDLKLEDFRLIKITNKTNFMRNISTLNKDLRAFATGKHTNKSAASELSSEVLAEIQITEQIDETETGILSLYEDGSVYIEYNNNTYVHHCESIQDVDKYCELFFTELNCVKCLSNTK